MVPDLLAPRDVDRERALVVTSLRDVLRLI